jgi:hypothetical protein
LRCFRQNTFKQPSHLYMPAALLPHVAQGALDDDDAMKVVISVWMKRKEEKKTFFFNVDATRERK